MVGVGSLELNTGSYKNIEMRFSYEKNVWMDQVRTLAILLVAFMHCHEQALDRWVSQELVSFL